MLAELNGTEQNVLEMFLNFATKSMIIIQFRHLSACNKHFLRFHSTTEQFITLAHVFG